LYACACFSTNKTEFCPTVLDYFPIFAIEILFLKHRISAIDSSARWEWSKRSAHRREPLNSNDATRLLEHPRSSLLARRAFGEPLAIGRAYSAIFKCSYLVNYCEHCNMVQDFSTQFSPLYFLETNGATY